MENYIIFETDHLSEYGIIASNNEKTQGAVDKTQNPQTGDNVLAFGIMATVATLGLAVSTIILKKRFNTK